MGKYKIHYEVIESAPNESDPDGWSFLLCGIEVCEECTTNAKAVTCKNCLKRLAQNKE